MRDLIRPITKCEMGRYNESLSIGITNEMANKSDLPEPPIGDVKMKDGMTYLEVGNLRLVVNGAMNASSRSFTMDDNRY